MKKVALAVLILLVACSSGSKEPEPYFKGSTGVEMKMPDQASPPGQIYYYPGGTGNHFDVSVEVWNKGSSLSRGGLYLSGYDPNMIQVDGIHPNKQFGVCDIGFQQLGDIFEGEFIASFTCGDGDGIRYEDGDVTFSADKFLDKLFEKVGKDDWEGAIEISSDLDDLVEGDKDFRNATAIDAELGQFNLEFFSRGVLALASFAPVDFDRRFGREYLLRGDVPAYPGGDVKIEDWSAEIKDFPPGLEKTTQNFLITNCYLYSTHAAPVVCIDPAPNSKQRKACQPSAYKGKGGQGAPVAVTRVTQENTRRQAIFHITVKNIGGGDVWNPGSIEKCNPYARERVTLQDKNKVLLGIARVAGSNVPLDCVPRRLIRLNKKGVGEVTCRYDIPFQGLKSAYQTPLVIELWYGYEETMRRSVTIRRGR